MCVFPYSRFPANTRHPSLHPRYTWTAPSNDSGDVSFTALCGHYSSMVRSATSIAGFKAKAVTTTLATSTTTTTTTATVEATEGATSPTTTTVETTTKGGPNNDVCFAGCVYSVPDISFMLLGPHRRTRAPPLPPPPVLQAHGPRHPPQPCRGAFIAHTY